MTTSNDSRNRKLWEDLVHKAITSAVASGNRFSVEEVLNSVGIHSLSIHRTQALQYCTKMLKPDEEPNPNEPTKE
jgi:hypothetical protein